MRNMGRVGLQYVGCVLRSGLMRPPADGDLVLFLDGAVGLARANIMKKKIRQILIDNG